MPNGSFINGLVPFTATLLASPDGCGKNAPANHPLSMYVQTHLLREVLGARSWMPHMHALASLVTL